MKTVLLLSRQNDAHIAPVQEIVRHMGGRVVFCDLADFPETIRLTAQISSYPDSQGWKGTFSYQGEMVVAEAIQSIWWRRPKRYQNRTESYPSEVRKLLDQEAYYGFAGLLFGSSDGQYPFWVSRPYAIRAAEFKVSQLAVARQLGLHIPRTLITNEPTAVQAFYEECQGNVICKPVWKGSLEFGEETLPDQPRFIYTNQVLPHHLEAVDGVRATAHCFQEYIDKRLEIRVVVIGCQMFAIGIDSQQSERTRIDWRRAYPDLHYYEHCLPDDLKQQLFQLVRIFGLQFASMDLILTPNGEYVWIEANPNGQFYWLEPPTGLPMAQAMANLLMHPGEYKLW